MRYRVFFPEHVLLGSQQCFHALKLSKRMPGQHLIPGMLIVWLLIHPVNLPLQPVKRLRQGHQKGVQALGHVPDFVLFKCFCEQAKVLAALRQQLIHGITESLLEQHLLLLFLTNPCQRIHTHCLKIVSDNFLAEGVDGRYFCAFQLVQRLPHTFRVALCFLQHALVQSLPHFSRSGPGEGYNQHTVKVIPLPHQAYDAFHQHRCFSGTCRGADKDGMVSCPDGRLLFFCPLGHIITSSVLFHVKHFSSFSLTFSLSDGLFPSFCILLIILYFINFIMTLIFLTIVIVSVL